MSPSRPAAGSAVPLRIVGTGPERARLERAGRRRTSSSSAGSPTSRSASSIARPAATLLPGTEDFGIVPVESQACGTPVVALDAGGARETVIDGETGVLVDGTSVEAFAGGLSARCARPSTAQPCAATPIGFPGQLSCLVHRAVEQAIADKAQGGNADAARWGATAPPVFPTSAAGASTRPLADCPSSASSRYGERGPCRSPQDQRRQSQPRLADRQRHRSSILMPQECPGASTGRSREQKMMRRFNRLLVLFYVLSDAVLGMAAFALAYLPALPRRRRAAHPAGQGRPAVPAGTST